MLRVKTRNEDYDSWIKAFCKRKYNSGFSREMTRSVEKALEEFRN